MKRKAVSGIMLTLLLASMLTLAFNIEPVSGGVYPAIYIEPATTVDATLTPGGIFTVSIKTDYTGDDIQNWLLTLSYNPNVLQLGVGGSNYTDVWAGDGRVRSFKTTGKLIVPESEKVYVNQVLMTREVDYAIDYQRGVMIFSSPPDSGTEVKAAYLYSLINGDLVNGDKDPSAMFTPGTYDNVAGTLDFTGAFFFFINEPAPTTSGPGTLANVTFAVVGIGKSNITLGPETKLRGYTEGGYGNLYDVIDAKTMPDHIQHGFFNNVQPIHDVAVVCLIAPAKAFSRQLVSINVIVANEGNYTESVIVKVSCDATEIETKSFTLASGLFEALSFCWETTGLTPGTYTLTAEVILAGDADLTDNCATKTVVVTLGALISVPYHHQITGYYCGPASLEMVFDFYGPDISQLEIAEVARTVYPGTSDIDMRRAAHFSNLSTSVGDAMPGNITGYSARELGYAAFEHRGFSLEELKLLIDSGYPITVITWFSQNKAYGHYRVVVGYNETHVILRDPWPLVGPILLNFTNSVFLDLWELSYYWGLFVSPWNVDVSAAQIVLEGDTFNVTAAVTYPCPAPFPTFEYPASMSNATIILPEGMSLVSGKNSKKLLDTGNMRAGDSATVSWMVHADNLGNYTIGIEVEGRITGSVYGYRYEDRIGGLKNVNVTVNPTATTVSVSIRPTMLNLRSEGRWITCYIELPEGYNLSDIDIYSIRLNSTIPVSLLPNPPLPTPTEIGDHDNDGVPDLMVKFSRTALTSHICHTLGIKYGNVTLIITGELFDGGSFEASDTMSVIFAGDICGMYDEGILPIPDGEVGLDDFMVIAMPSHIFTSEPDWDPVWGPICDLNKDSRVGIADLMIVGINYGATVVP